LTYVHAHILHLTSQKMNRKISCEVIAGHYSGVMLMCWSALSMSITFN